MKIQSLAGLEVENTMRKAQDTNLLHYSDNSQNCLISVNALIYLKKSSISYGQNPKYHSYSHFKSIFLSLFSLSWQSYIFCQKVDCRLNFGRYLLLFKVSRSRTIYPEELQLRNHPRELPKYHLCLADLIVFSFLQHSSLKPSCLFLFLKQCCKLLFFCMFSIQLFILFTSSVTYSFYSG